MNPVTQNNQQRKLLKEYRILKVWVPDAQESSNGKDLPGYRYAMQQRVEVQVPDLDEDGKMTGEYHPEKMWMVRGEGNEEWAKLNAEHYGIEVPTEEYILEEHQDPEED